MHFFSFIKVLGPLCLFSAQCLATPVHGGEVQSRSLVQRTPKKKDATPKITTSIPMGGYWGTDVVITIGKIDFNVLFDTGSSDLLLCGVPGLGNPAHTYPLTAEQRKSKKTFVIAYDDGTEDAGVEVEDTVTIGGVPVKMSIAVSTTCAMGNVTDGLLGASNFIKPTPNVPTLMEAIKGQLQQPTFAMSIASEKSSMVLGEAPDKSMYTTELMTVNTDRIHNSWGLPNVTFTFGDISVTGAMAMDSGTTWTELPAVIVDAYHQKIPGARIDQNGAWFLPCNSTMPNLTFTEPNNPGKIHTIPGQPLIGFPLSFEPGMCDSFLVSESHLMWFPGWAFFSTHYTWFNIDSATMSFAMRAPTHGKTLSNITSQHNGAAFQAPPPPSKMIISEQ